MRNPLGSHRLPKPAATELAVIFFAKPEPLQDNTLILWHNVPRMIPALLLIPLVALFRIFMAWQPVGGTLHTWLPGTTPVAAVALCAGIFLPRRLALVIPLGILLLSDAIIDVHFGASYFSILTFVDYALLASIGLCGIALRRKFQTRAQRFPAVLAATLAGSLFFYLGSNALAWLGSPDYPQTVAGLMQALTVGLPGYVPSYVFFRNGLVSDALYSMVFVACVRLTLPAGERFPAFSRSDVEVKTLPAEARHQG